MNVIAGAAGIAPVIGPLLGAAILRFSQWRLSFWVVGALALVMLAVVAISVPETLPAGRRHRGGVARLVGSAAVVLRDRRFVGYLLVFGFSMGAIFAYVATSAFVWQSMNGLSPTASPAVIGSPSSTAPGKASTRVVGAVAVPVKPMAIISTVARALVLNQTRCPSRVG
jgi:predicted MFS family arabinose efflux permease